MNQRRHQSSSKRVGVGVAAPAAQLVGWRLWTARLLLMLGGPLFFFAVVEIILRLIGFGHPTDFLLSSFHQGTKTFVQNNQFGWRFFGARRARTPHPLSIPQTKPEGTVRIFVFGESAAYGDPQPRSGLPRVLEAMLSLRYPGPRFEVVNAAMTGINSHVVVPIARDCARAGGDIWVIYLGNNEVVGPFGAGTVFGPQVPPRPVIRASLALQSTRTGQALEALRERWQGGAAAQGEWGGMAMFLDQQVRADEPRLRGVYRHFEQNLADLLAAGRKAGVGLVVSTVAVNLKDCAPFASAHRPDLGLAERAQWEQFFAAGVTAEQAGQLREAAAAFREAALRDDRFAELRFRQARLALALGAAAEARQHFQAARDLDTLRFRCDRALNDQIRRQAGGQEAARIILADAEKIFAEQSPGGLPGADLFYEHVHLNFRGNYLLAQALAAGVEQLLPSRVTAGTARTTPWPSPADCARRLARTDRDEAEALAEILSRLAGPPFTAQIDHRAQVQRLTAQRQKMPDPDAPESIREARLLCEAALSVTPDDPLLHGQLALLKQSGGDGAGAVSSARRALDLRPSDAEAWSQYGLLLVAEKKFEDAAAAFRRGFQLDSQDVSALQNLAQTLVQLNRPEDALREYRRAVALKPRFGPAWLSLGQLLETRGQAEEAAACYRQALAHRLPRAPELTTLARFCQGRGWREAAATNYADAVRLNPSDAWLQLEAGQNLAALGRRGEAARHYAKAVQLAPDLAQAHFLYGLELGRAGQPAEAVRELRAVVRLMPDAVEARLDLGMALSDLGQTEEARREFAWVLQRQPTNEMARAQIEILRQRTEKIPPR